MSYHFYLKLGLLKPITQALVMHRLKQMNSWSSSSSANLKIERTKSNIWSTIYYADVCGVSALACALRATTSAHPPQDVPSSAHVLGAHVLGEKSGPLVWVSVAGHSDFLCSQHVQHLHEVLIYDLGRIDVLGHSLPRE